MYMLSANGLLNAVVGGQRSSFGDSDTALWSIAGLDVVDDVRDNDVVLPRRAAGDPDRRLRGRSNLTRGDMADVQEDRLPLLKPAHFLHLQESSP